MSSKPTEHAGIGRRSVHVRLSADVAASTTTLTRPDGTQVVRSAAVDYRSTPHGLCRWTDPVDGLGYVIGSGALGGAAHFVAGTDGPADRMPTDITVDPVAADDVVRSTFGDLASPHLGLVAGPWRVRAAPGAEVLVRQGLDRDARVVVLLEETRRALDWLLDWFGGDRGPWGAAYTQVLVPGAPWLAMEHPGCVLLSERLLDVGPGQRAAVLAHEAAHQWVGNLVSPLTWPDVGAFEGLAELMGQLAAEELAGGTAAAVLSRRRAKGPLALAPTPCDLRTLPATAGLAEVAGPVQHAELFRAVRSDLGAHAFRARVRELVRRHAGSACSATDLWTALGVPPRQPPTIRLPVVDAPRGPAAAGWRTALTDFDAGDPATAAVAARRAFRDCAPGPHRVRQALAAVADPATPYPVVAGLAAELSRCRR